MFVVLSLGLGRPCVSQDSSGGTGLLGPHQITFRFTLYSTWCVVDRAPRGPRERWLQVLDGMRRSRRRRCHHHDQADDGVLSTRDPEVSLGTLRSTGRARSPRHIRGRFPRQIHISKVEGMVHDAVEAPSRRWRCGGRPTVYPASTPSSRLPEVPRRHWPIRRSA